MTERVKKLYERQKNGHIFPLCTERLHYATEAFINNEGLPTIIKRAKAAANYLDNRTLFIEDDEILIYNIASRPNGMEMTTKTATWEDDDLELMLQDGTMTITPEERANAHSYDSYYLEKGRSLEEHRRLYLDEKRLLPFAKRGFIVPPWTPNSQRGGAGDNWGMKISGILMTPDYEYQLNLGFEEYVRQCKEKLETLHINSEEDMHKSDFLQASIIAIEACIRMGYRYADLAKDMAEKCTDPVRKKELIEIEGVCRQVPAKPARTFREALQAFIFYFFLCATGTQGCGRMDQYLYPFYKADIEAGRITREDALELIELMRLKLMQFQVVQGGKFQREKWAGMARWNNIILGGCDPKTGKDATNELTYLFLESAKEVRTTHPTMTIRVGKDTPDSLMNCAADLVSTGIGMPAFISEDGYIDYIHNRGLSLEESRKFAIAGCLDITMPGAARMQAVSMFIVPMVIETTCNNGQNYRTGEQLGPQTGYLRDMKTFEEFYDAFLKQMDYLVGCYVEYSNIKLMCDREFADVIIDSLCPCCLENCKDILAQKAPFENGLSFNVVGMPNAINALAGLKKVVFDDKLCTPAEMHEALLNNWKDREDLRKACLDAPKYGNNDDYVDSIGEKVWVDIRKMAEGHKSLWNEPLITSAISITAHAPGGKITGATPDGRYDEETLGDGSTSPVQGTDKNGPLAVLNSAMRMSKGWSVNLLNMKISPSSLETSEDKAKLASMTKTFLTNGGKQIQYNVVDKKTLETALEHKDQYKNLIVRVAGYSAYFVELTPRIQHEVMDRTEHIL